MTRKTRTPVLILLWTLTLLWTAALFGFSGQDGPQSSDLSTRFTQFILNLFPFLPFSLAELEPVMRKLAHFTLFAIEGMLICSSLALTLRGIRQSAKIAMPACIILAIFNELHQSLTIARNCSVWDMLLDSCGAATGILLIMLARHLMRRRNAIIS